MALRPVLKGLLTYIPGSQSIFMRAFLPRKGTGGSNSARYCYEVWLKHLTLLWRNGMRTMPETLGELGPGDSLGVGLAAMLSGVNHYYALDVVRYTNAEFNLQILDDLVDLFKVRAGKKTRGWPDVTPDLDESAFPSHILTEDRLEKTLAEERISLIRKALAAPEPADRRMTIKYMVPWSDEAVMERESVDAILSHSVLEHVADLEATYRACRVWLRPGGMMSHQIDFTSHGLSEKWNGYRAYSERLWKVIVGRRPFFINREPCSVHIDLLRRNQFDITCHLKNYRNDGIARSELSSYWKGVSDDDLTCAGTFIQSKKN